jgi:EF hand
MSTRRVGRSPSPRGPRAAEKSELENPGTRSTTKDARRVVSVHRQVFNELDTNRSGAIDFDELARGVAKLLPSAVFTRYDIATMLEKVFDMCSAHLLAM